MYRFVSLSRPESSCDLLAPSPDSGTDGRFYNMETSGLPFVKKKKNQALALPPIDKHKKAGIRCHFPAWLPGKPFALYDHVCLLFTSWPLKLRLGIIWGQKDNPCSPLKVQATSPFWSQPASPFCYCTCGAGKGEGIQFANQSASGCMKWPALLFYWKGCL